MESAIQGSFTFIFGLAYALFLFGLAYRETIGWPHWIHKTTLLALALIVFALGVVLVYAEDIEIKQAPKEGWLLFALLWILASGLGMWRIHRSAVKVADGEARVLSWNYKRLGGGSLLSTFLFLVAVMWNDLNFAALLDMSMGHVFIWVFSLASALLFLSLVYRLTVGLANWVKSTLRIAATLMVMSVGMGVMLIGVILNIEGLQPSWLGAYGLFWFVTSGLVAGLHIERRDIKEAVREARFLSWDPWRLGEGFLFSILLLFGTVFWLDSNIRFELAIRNTMNETVHRYYAPGDTPDSLNSALIYADIIKSFKIDLAKIDNIPLPIDDPSSDAFKKKLATLERLQPARAMIEQAINLPGFRPRVAYDPRVAYEPGKYFNSREGYYAYPIPPFVMYRAIQYLLKDWALLDAHRNDAVALAHDLNLMRDYSKQVAGDSEGSLVSALIASGIKGIEANTVEQALGVIKGNLPIAVTSRTVPHHDYVTMVVNATMLEPAIFHSATAMFNSVEYVKENNDLPGPHSLVRPLYNIYCLQDDLRAIDEISEKIATLFINKPIIQAEHEFDAWRSHTDTKKGSYFASIVFSADTYNYTYIHKGAIASARAGFIDLAFAMTSFKQVEGKYPATLESLIPRYIDSIPTDPFDGKPLKMRAQGDGLILYSAGRDNNNEELRFHLGSAWDEYHKKQLAAAQAIAAKATLEKERLKNSVK